MKRWSWAALSAAVVVSVGVCGIAVHRAGSPNRQDEHAGMKPVSTSSLSASVPAPSTGMIAPHVVNFRSLPVVQHPAGQPMKRLSKKDQGPGKENEKRERSQISEAEADARRAQAMQQPVKPNHIQELRDVTPAQRRPGVQNLPFTGVVNLLAGFDGPDISQCCGASASVPPDTHMAAGLNHVIATVNSAIGIYNKQGQLLNGPVTSDAFFNTANCTGTFDPTVEYDEGANRFIINYDASPNDCIAVSQTSDPTGKAWSIRSVPAL